MEETQFLEINAKKRTIAVPSDLLLGVLGDKDVERVYFRCPKIVGDNINLAEHQIYVKYVTAPDKSGERYDKKEPGIYHCQDVIDEGEHITFSWKLSGHVFEEEGFVAFSVFAADGEVTRWNTFPAIGTVLITIPGGLEEVAEKYPDIITQLLNRMDEVEAIATPEAMQMYVDTYLAEHPVELDETLTDNTKAAPADVVGELKEETNHALQQSKATAIISTIKGEMLSTHSSAAIPPRNLKVFGKSWQDGEPSIDYPQEIKSLGSGGSIGGKLIGENLIDVNGIYVADWGVKQENGTRITVDGEKVTIEVLKESNSIRIPLLKPTKSFYCSLIYTFSDGVEANARPFAFRTKSGSAYGSLNLPGTIINLVTPEHIYTIDIGEGNNVKKFAVGTTITLSQSYLNETGNEFTPYIATQSFIIQTPNGLHGIPLGQTIYDVIKNSPIHMSGVHWDNATSQYYISDTIDYESGKSIQRIARYYVTIDDDIGKSSMSTNELSNFYLEKDIVLGVGAGEKSLVMSNIVSQGFSQTFNVLDTAFVGGGSNSRPYFCVSADKASTVEEFKELCVEKGVYIDYVLIEPIETDLTAEEIAQYQALCMNYPNTTIINDAGAYMEVEYVEDTELYLTGNYVPISEHNALASRVSALEQMALN